MYRRYKRIIALFYCVISINNFLQAQDFVFTQFFNMPMQVNPANTGNVFAPRISAIYRNQWTGLGAAYQTIALSGDTYFDKLNLGLGANISYDSEGKGIMGTTIANVNVAYHLQFTDKLYASFGANAGFIQKRLNTSRLVFGNQIDATTGNINAGNIIIPNLNTFTPDASGGLMVYAPNFFVGVGLNHVYVNNKTFTNQDFNLPMRLNFNAGYQIKLEGKKTIRSITPMLLVENQKPFTQINIGAIVSGSKFYAGLAYRNVISNSDAVLLHVGYKYGTIALGYSYDATISQLMNYGYGSHELSFTFDLSKSDSYISSKNSKKYLDCFKMFK